jgi:hypothetical protein
MDDERVERSSVSIYPSQWAIIDEKAMEIGDPGNRSAGLKAVVAEYERLKMTGRPGNGQAASALTSSGQEPTKHL